MTLPSTLPARHELHALPILHIDAACIVVDKPAGLLAVPGRGEHLQDCASARVQAAYPDALVVHRLDMSTSGLMLFARGAAAQRVLNDAFAQRAVDKRYVAVVHGRLVDAHGEIDLPLLGDWPNRPLQKVDRAHGKPSLTRYRVIDSAASPANATNEANPAHGAGPCTTRVELEPVTGRAHQLRVHLLAIGHPIVGDALYAPPAVHTMAARLLLHAVSLRFAHPVSGALLSLESAAPF